MADWIGHLLAQLPGWLFLPALIVVVIVASIVWWIDATLLASWPFQSKRSYLGENKHGKK